MVERASAVLGADPTEAGRQADAILRLARRSPRTANPCVVASTARDAAGASGHSRTAGQGSPAAGAHTHYELGAAPAARDRRREAATALRHALSLNRDLAEAWRALGDLLFRAGDAPGAERAFTEHHRATIRDPALRPAAEALFAGRLAEAEQRLQAHLAVRPADPAALRLLAEARARRDCFVDAETLLAEALRLDPAHDGARFSYATALFRQQKAAEALAQLQPLLATDPEEAAYRNPSGRLPRL